ncbi:DsrE family protein [Methylophaga sp. OBS4]|uniref:DsrE family protein n=1 Tax=Methylophaga sp. OBS4 TaxID=2991935 RepID=UPI00225B784D|nr:DsrE family protein [Methylophaga sp. OBS4]MCX4186878.1 DsrE family protein [Methylophaga sp. OBS4]
MPNYLIIQSQDPFSDARTKSQYELIHNLASAENTITVLLVQNGVMPARRGSIYKPFDLLCYQNINILADKFSLEQRQISIDQLKPGVLAADLDVVIKAMLSGHKVIWH